MLTIGQYKHGALDAAQELLDDHTAAGVAKHATQHLFQLLLGLLQRRQDEHAFACTEAVGLQHIGSLQRFQETQAILQMLPVKGLIGRRWDMMTLHECLGEVFRTFEHGTCLRGADDGDVIGAFVTRKLIVDTLH